MTCKDCQERNPIGNKFCRECGAKIIIPEGSLAAEEAARAEAERRAERGAVLLSDAHHLAEQGKYVGAIPVAEEAVATVPFSASAYTLLVTLYEHTDQVEKAIAAQEKVIDLLPNAPKEVVRLEKLKRGERTSLPPALAVTATNVPTLRGATPNTVPFGLPQWFPVAAGAVAGGFALYLGYVVMSPGKPAPETPSLTITASPVPQSTPLATNPGAMPPPPADSNRGGDPFVSLDATRTALQQQTATRPATRPLNITAGAALPLPKSLPGAKTARTTVAPLIVPPEIVKGSITGTNTDPLPPISAAPPKGFGDGERVAAAPPSNNAARSANYRMEISVNKNGSTPPIDAAPPRQTAPDMESNPLERARALQSIGRYTDAVAAYRDAIANGASMGETQQSIGLCYQRAGDGANARVAYLQAIAAFKAQIASGRNPGAAQRGLNSCEAALGVLGGE